MSNQELLAEQILSLCDEQDGYTRKQLIEAIDHISENYELIERAL